MARYGRKHHTLRLQLLPLAYGHPCARCGEPMLKGQLLDLDHDERDPSGTTYRGFSHRSCNRSTAGPHAKGFSEPPIANPQPNAGTRW